MLDLIVRGGQVVTPHGVGSFDIGIQGERIALVRGRQPLRVPTARRADLGARSRRGRARPFGVRRAVAHGRVHRGARAGDRHPPGGIDRRSAELNDQPRPAGREAAHGYTGRVPPERLMLLDGYGLDLTPERDDNIRAYRILWNLEALHFEFRAGGDWFDSYRGNIQLDVGHRK